MIRSARHDHELTQQQLATALRAASGNDSVGRDEVARWERGRRIPSAYWQRWLSLVLDISRPELHAAAQRSRALRRLWR
ncbi:helix-turn-helix domain-containing protein [Amycolatopsis alkalitolerans]|uniref:helix-turn-helix domain-containing protein n=1 Tax=Amycolatopsis alkalitolerans TaxID=2547244 RepID=UPI001F26DC3F|nr:helix-turn-helix transcriptional regulator [Amycolatopsis alkalitolerans]